MKNWKTYTITVNGLTIKASYNQDTVENLFFPFLRKLTEMHRESQKRIVVFLAAPPAVGKTTLSLFLESLSRSSDDLEDVKAIGLDGFHYHADYLASHTTFRDGEEVEMTKVKGCPETFDAEKLERTLARIHTEDIKWPIYFRNIHDVVEDGDVVTGNIVLLEGNWLLLKDERWAAIRKYADYAVMIQAEESMLKERLINRKMQGGTNREDAEAFYEYSDSRNVTRTLQDSVNWDVCWKVEADGDFQQV